MSTANRYYAGTTVSRYLSPDGRAWAGVLFQSGKPVLDAELQLEQDAAGHLVTQVQSTYLPSGWLRPQGSSDSAGDYITVAPGVATNAIELRAAVAMVAGYPVRVEFANTATAGRSRIVLTASPSLGGAPPDVKRTDFVFLEAWLALVAPSPRATGTVLVLPALPAPGDTVVLNGLPLTAVAGAPGIDQFTIGVDEVTTASNIAVAINDPLNSFATFVSASSGGTDTVTIKAAVPGAAGNLITLSTTGGAMLPSGATLAGGADRPNKPTQDTVYRNGCVQAPAPVNLPDDLADPVIDAETTQRVQLQWRLRVTGESEAVNFKTQPLGFQNPNVLAQGTQLAPVVGYGFLPADGVTVSGSSSAAAYGQVDSGLWIAGDGSSGAAVALGTADGFVYAIPVAMVFRRNDAYLGGAGVGFDPLNNTNGALPYGHALFANPAVGAIPGNVSDRPDGLFSDVIALGDVLDLRRSVVPTGVDLSAELVRQVQLLLDGGNRTWAIDGGDKNVLGAGSGDVSTRYLVCNQIGRDNAHGGAIPTSGDTTRGTTIRNFDHVARRFGAQQVVERFVVEVFPGYTPAPSGTDPIGHPGAYNTQANLGYSGWAVGDVVTIDLGNLNASSLGSFDPTTNTYAGFIGNASVADFAPPGTVITDIISIYHDDGNYAAAVDQRLVEQNIVGLGSMRVEISLDTNTVSVDGGGSVAPHRMVGDPGLDDGSPRRIFVELEITYPAGVGTTDTPSSPALAPDPGVYPAGPVLENQPLQRPLDWEGLRAPDFREGHREVKVEYVANDGSGVGAGTPITDSLVSRSATTLVFPRRVHGSVLYPVGVTDSVAAQPHNIDNGATEYGSSSRLVTVTTGGGPADSPLSGAGQTLCAVTYFAQDPLPNYGAAGGGYQLGVYYRTVAAATAGVQPGAMAVIPDPVSFQLLAVLGETWTAVTGKGSQDVPFPYINPMDYLPVNDDGTATFPGEWFFQGNAAVSVSDFEAETGLLRLHTFVQADASEPLVLSGKNKDVEYRAFYGAAATANGYRPSSATQPLSGVARHKAFTAALARATADTDLYRRGEVLLLVFGEFLALSEQNAIVFPTTNTRSSVAVYRTTNLFVTP